MLLPIHVVAGGLAMVLGAVALLVKKGGNLHRRSGLLFVCAMLVMGITTGMLGNAFGGLITIYFVVTALTTVHSVSPWTRGTDVVAMVFAVAFTLFTFLAGVEAFHSPGGLRNGVPFPMFFFLGTVTLLAVIGDLRVLRAGLPRGGRRLARHLWRMCFALFIAAASFFSIRERVAKLLPEPFTTVPMRALPILLLFGAMFYWLWRVRGRHTSPALARSDSKLG